MALSMPGPWEWLVILAILLLLFGKRLPEVMRSMGRGIKEFKSGMHDEVEGAKGTTDADTSGGSDNKTFPPPL